ncbi:Cell wall-associated polypeptide CWBP200 [Propionibacterium australiense]|uniref:RHS Repeat n=1 Tax=Propionibacterium australiense TaxID=119981 RepID=A0A383S8A6_9ACTN|nr:RHS Repeat [Propionibacterium australiense]VEH88878.1 Cell wall-associated polypeptide CWBP200 [Propionibacterium australiense]
MKEAAAAERERRRQAKEWAERQDRETFLKRGWDWLTNRDQPPAGPPAKPVVDAEAPTVASWSEPGPGAAGGVSSARPDDLRTYSSNVSGANDTVVTQKGTLEGAITDFVERCSWCSINTSGITGALASFEANNANEVRWVDTVAAAFEAAGGSGTVSSLSDVTLAECLAAAGVAETRRPLDVQAPSIQGDPQTSGYADDPVNTTTGNFVEPETDLSFTGGAASLVFSRMYNSLSQVVGSFGPGWASTADEHLVFNDEGAVWVQASGRHVVFPRLADGWDRADGDSFWLTTIPDTTAPGAGENTTVAAIAGDAAGVGGGGTEVVAGEAAAGGATAAGGGFVVSDNAGGRWCFDRAGRPAWTSRGAGTRVDYEWAGGRLVGLWHEWGRGIRLVWDPEGSRVVALVASDGRRVDYAYDGSGRLTAAVSDGGATRTYAWNEQGLICRVTDPDGVVEVENTYNQLGQVVTQRSAFGRVSHYSYLPGGVTQVADADGGRANTWVHDRKGRLVGMVDADGYRQSIGWDRWGNRVLVTGRDGRATICRYDERGRLATRVEETGARSDYEYDGLDRVVRVSVTTGDGQGGPAGTTGGDEQAGLAVTTYEYSGSDRNPSTITDPEGGVSYLTWDRNLLVGVVDPTGVPVRLGYDEHGDLVSSTNAAGDTARLVRDDAGRVVAAVTPLGYRTEYRYDQAGRLASRQDPDGAVWRYEHTAGGRLSVIVAPDGGCTRVEYGPGGAEHATTDPLGRRVVMGYDDLGNTAEAVLPDGSRWEFGYDGLSRLRWVTDAAGGRAELSYDKNGNLTGSTDPTGVVQSFGYGPAGLPVRAADPVSEVGAGWDGLGRLVEQVDEDGSVTRVRHDLCGRPVEVVDATGGVTRVERDAAGRPVRITQPGGACFGYEYDVCGRWSATVSTGGRRYEICYDADGRIVGEVWPTGERVRTRFDECGRIVERFEPGRGLTRFGYDRCGRISWVRDTWNGHRRFGYDAAGQLVSVTNALGGVTCFDYDELGRVVAAIDPMGGRSGFGYDRMGRLTSRTDPNGRTAHFSYDKAGRRTMVRDGAGTAVEFSYDCSGRLSGTVADGATLMTRSLDFAGRRLMMTGAGGRTEALTWNALGLLVERRRGDQVVRWGYDADGRRTWMRHPDGSVTRYEYDDDSRLCAVEHPGLGRAEITRDGIGRVTGLDAEGLHATWRWEAGGLVAHEVNRRGFVQSTRIERDSDGRVVAQTVDGIRTEYSYDAAGQLVQSLDSEGFAGAYRWDENGRMVRREYDGQATTFTYDRAGQLLSRSDRHGRTVYAYDGAGRRVREQGPDGERRYGWDPRGFLDSITEIVHDGDRVRARTRRLDVDQVGELASVDDLPVVWDTAAGSGSLAGIGELPVVDVGVGVGLGGRAPGWLTSTRGTRDGEPIDPWQTLQATGLAPGQGGDSGPAQGPGRLGDDWLAQLLSPGPGTGGGDGDGDGFAAPWGVGLTGSGGLTVAGMEWTGARVYDPVTAGFLSTDPLPPVLGAGWAANPYSYAGNDPVNLSDPTGLRPLSDADLQGWKDQHKTGLAAAGDWVKDNWEYLAAGAAIVAGVALMCTGVGSGAGLALMAASGALMSGGISIASQKYSNGSVNWGHVGVEAAIGAVAGLAGGGAYAGVRAASQGMSCLGRNVLAGAASGAADGGLSSGLGYLAGPGPHTPGGLTQATGLGALQGGGLGAAGGALSKVSGVTDIGCFRAGTQVLMADGTAKNIEDVTEGDQVLSWDPDQGQNTASRVARTFVHDKVATLRVTTEAGELVTTTNHPFYVEHKGWTPAGELTAGDQLRDPDGGTVTVTRLQATGTMETVHNLGVAGTHNYYVRTGTTWALAHNSGSPSKTCQEITQKIQELAQAEADKGIKALREGFSPEQIEALKKKPWLEKMFAGTTIHNRVKEEIRKLFPSVEYSSNDGPDFRIPKELSGADVDEYVELTTGGQIPAHRRRAARDSRYEDAQYAEYEFPGKNP